jgi:hypothetical protein
MEPSSSSVSFCEPPFYEFLEAMKHEHLDWEEKENQHHDGGEKHQHPDGGGGRRSTNIFRKPSLSCILSWLSFPAHKIKKMRYDFLDMKYPKEQSKVLASFLYH